MTWLALWAALELGWLPHGTMLIYEPRPEYRDLTGEYYVQMEAEVVAFDRVFVAGEVKTFMFDQAGELAFLPTQALYGFRAGLRLPPLEVGWRHYCTHPVMPYMPIEREGPVLWEGAYDEVYVRFETRR